MALLIGTPIGIFAGTFLAENGKNLRIGSVTRFVNDVLLSAPSILIGLFVYQLLVLPFRGYSALAGSVALAILIIPVVVRATEDMLNLVPVGLREAAFALGAPQWKVVMMITWRAARAGIATGILLALARAAGETAPLIFTSFGNSQWSLSLNQPMASLPVAIYQYAGQPGRRLGVAGLGRRAADHGGRAGDECRYQVCVVAVEALSGAQEMNETNLAPRNRVQAAPPVPSVFGAASDPGIAAGHAEDQGREPRLLLRREPRPEVDRRSTIAERKVTAMIGPSGCGKSTLLRVFNRMYDLYPGPARDGHGAARRDEPDRPEARRDGAQEPHRHGVPEADAVSHVDLRQHRLRRAPA